MNNCARSLCAPDNFCSAETPWDGRKFSVIYMDAPWKYGNYTDKAHGAAAAHYKSMTVEDLAALNIAQYAADDCTLVTWATWPKLDEAMKLGEKWGFRYITGFPWIKYVPSISDAQGFFEQPPTEQGKHGLQIKSGCGFVVRQCSEPLLWWRRGDPSRDPEVVNQVGLLYGIDQRTFWAPVRGHSRKPPEVRAQLLKEFPRRGHLEIFATEFCNGWTSWGKSIGTVLVPGTPGVVYEDSVYARRGQRAADNQEVPAGELPIQHRP